jgi:hypothetical protein
MAKVPKIEVSASKARVKMTVIHFETESSNEALQENIKSIVSALTKALSPQAKSFAPILTSKNGRQEEAETKDEIEDSDEEIQEEEDNEGEEQTDVLKSKVRQPGKTRTPQTIHIELVKGDKPLKVFLDEKNPEGNIKRYLAISYWLNKFGSILEVNMDHSYTCYRHMGWQVPKDAGAPFRQLKSPKYGWMNSGKEKASFVINHIGENEVEKMGNPK